jgi:hypothetical protein
MNRTALSLLIAAASLAPIQIAAQDALDPSTSSVGITRSKLSGPRFGFTTFTGAVADQRRGADLETIMSQFGWQFETRLVSQESGNQALLEWLFLVGGVESDEFNLSGSFLTGYRLANGLEFGVGPSFSYNPDAESHTSSMVIAGGTTIPFGELFIPMNIAIAMAKGGPRITTLIGWVIG